MENSDVLPTNTVNGRVGNLLNTLGIPRRVIVSIFAFLAIINASSLRLCLDTTLEHIVNSNSKFKLENTYACGDADSLANCKYLNCLNDDKIPISPWVELGNIFRDRSSTSWPEVKLKFWQKFECPQKAVDEFQLNWDKHMQIEVVVSFYIGYVLSQIPGGILAQKYGGKRVLAVSLTSAAILTLLTPVTIKNGGLGPLIVLRILLGLSEGPAFPALSLLLAKWVPANERGKLCSFALSGGQVGVVIVNIVSTMVFHLTQWPVIFYFFGACALIWALGFVLLCSDEPASDPYIRPDECLYLQEFTSDNEPNLQLTPIPWRAIFVNVPVWAMISSAIQYNWAQAEVMTLFPPIETTFGEQTLAEELCEKVKASMPHIINWGIAVVFGTVGDTLVELELLSTTEVRKIMATITALGPRLINDFNSCLTCTDNSDLISRTNCAVGVIGTFYAGAKLTPLDLSPNYSGILMAISNGVGSLSAILMPQLEELYPNSCLFRNLRSTLCLISALLTSGDVQNFDSASSSINMRRSAFH